MNRKTPRKVFVEGPIEPEKIMSVIAGHTHKTNIGAHEIFMGQVRADEIEQKRIKAIEFTAYEEMAASKLTEIREVAFEKYELNCVHIYHSLGTIMAGKICFFVMTSSAHRVTAREATTFLVEEIKAKVPIFGKEIFEDDSHVWKKNT